MLKILLNKPAFLMAICILMFIEFKVFGQELISTKTTYEQGDDLVFNFKNAPGNPKDWIGIYKEGEVSGEVSATMWLYVDGTHLGETEVSEGVLNFPGELPVGKFAAHLLENDSYNILATASFEIKMQSVIRVELSKESFKNDEKISVSFSGGPGNQKDWIAIYKEGEIPGEMPSLRWSYLDGRNAGELVFDELWIGDYNLYFFENDGYNELASASFSVAMPIPSFSPRTLDVAQGSEISFSILGDYTSGNTLSKLDAHNAIQDKWGKRKQQLKEERTSEIINKSILLDGRNLKYKEKIFGPEPEDGRSLWISMHGGGAAASSLNDEQWNNQINLYSNIPEGFYIAPRATTDTWNMWFQPHVGEMFDRLIENYIAYHDVNPNKVYLLGYSAGGDGVYRLAPRMADRWAAASMMAGHPGESQPDNLYNIGFGLFMGAKDSAYDRNVIAEKWKGYLADLQNSEPLGYKHLVKIYPDKPHWMDTLDREAIPWMAEFERDPWPNKIIWRQDGVFQERFYWLEMPVESRIVAPQTYEQRTVATVQGQTIRVATSADPSITIRLSDQLVNLDEPITVIVNQKEKFKGLVPRSLNEIERSLAARPDPSSCSVASLTIGSGSIIEINSETLIDSDLSYQILTKPKNGVLSGEAPNLVYTPNHNYSGSDSFSYKANNGTVESNTAIVTINVVGKEKAEPVLNLSRTNYKLGDPITISFSGGPGNKLDWIGIYEDGGDEVKFWRYVDGTTDGNTGLRSGEILMESTLPIGEYKVSLFLNDTYEIIVTSAFSIIQDIIENTPPVVQGESLSVNEGGSVVISLSGVDDDDDTLSFRVVKLPENGELGGQIPNLVYTPNIGFTGNDTIEYVADDGQSESNQATVFIKVLAKPLLPDGVYFFEDFDSLILRPFESDTEEGGDNTDWTPNGPDGWVVRKGPNHGPTEEGEAVKEFDGWTFLDPNSWAATAGQFRDKFTKGVGVIAVADSDEYDDKVNTSFNSSLETPAIDISAATANSLKLSYDSSWRQEPQIGKVSVVYDEGAEIQLLNMDEGSSDGFNETIVLDMANPIGAKSVVVKWHYEGSNNWWWAIDNIKIAGAYNTMPTAGNQSVNVEEDGSVSITLDASDNDGDLLSYTLITQPKNGSLSGVAPDLVYTPNEDYTGEDAFTYKVNDGKADSNVGSVFINVSKKKEDTTLSLQFGEKSDAVQAEFDFWENISVKYYGGKGNSEDWIGVRMVGETGPFKLWSYLRPNPVQGDVHFGPLTPGLYEVVWINDGYRQSEARFKVLQNNDSPTNPSLTWTVFIYGNADHDLTPTFLKDIEEMKRANGSEFFNIVILSDLDGSEKTYSKKRGKVLDSYGVKEEHKYKVTKGIIVDSQHQIIEVMPEQDTDDANVLEEFLDWGMTSYKADRYGVILWNHGGQWNGFGGDYNNGERYVDSKPLWDKPNMKSDEIKNAITNVLTKHGLTKLDFLSYDTCLMGGAEVLVDVHDICETYIACPEVDYGNGWDYSSTLSYLKAHPDISTIEFASREVKIWDAHHSRSESDLSFKSHVAYDMSRFNEYNTALRIFTKTLLEVASRNSTSINMKIAEVRRNAIHYWNSGRSREGSNGLTDYIDLGFFAEQISKNFDGNLRKASLELLDAIENMVIAKASGKENANGYGLSIYYPIGGDVRLSYSPGRNLYYNLQTEHEIKFRAKLNFLTEDYGGQDWLSYLGLVKNMRASDKTAPQIFSGDDGSRSGRSVNAVELVDDVDYFKATYEEPAILSFEVTDGDDAYSAQAALVSNELTGNSNDYIYLGEIANALLDGEGEYEVEWDSTLPIISYRESDFYDPIYLGGWSMAPGSNLLMSLADYEPKNGGATVPLILITRFDDQGYGVIDNILEDTVATGSVDDIFLSSTTLDYELEPGGKLWPVYYMEELSDDGGYESFFVGFEDVFVTIPDDGLNGLEISYQSVDEGNYIVEVQTFDFFDNGSEILSYFVNVPDNSFTQLSPVLSVGIENGEFYVSWPKGFEDYKLYWSQTVKGSEYYEVQEQDIELTESGYFFNHSVNNFVSRFYKLIKK